MKTRLLMTAALVLPAALLGGCLPLEQAPLVYSSTTVMGARMKAGPGDAALLEANVGYVQADNAIVPVGVAKPCYAGLANSCANVDYDVKFVQGQNEQSAERVEAQIRLERARDSIATARAIIAEKNILIASEQAKLVSMAQLDAKKARMNQLVPSTITAADGTPATTPLSAAEAAERASLEQEIATLEALKKNKSNIENSIENLKAQVAQAEKQRLDAEAELGAIVEKLKNAPNSNDKKDALSVYSSFNGSGGARRDGASLTVGKVFSTGVAAQNLTEAAKTAAGVEALSKCLALAQVSVNDMPTNDDAAKTAKQDRLNRLTDYCMRPVGDRPS